MDSGGVEHVRSRTTEAVRNGAVRDEIAILASIRIQVVISIAMIWIGEVKVKPTRDIYESSGAVCHQSWLQIRDIDYPVLRRPHCNHILRTVF